MEPSILRPRHRLRESLRRTVRRLGTDRQSQCGKAALTLDGVRQKAMVYHRHQRFLLGHSPTRDPIRIHPHRAQKTTSRFYRYPQLRDPIPQRCCLLSDPKMHVWSPSSWSSEPTSAYLSPRKTRLPPEPQHSLSLSARHSRCDFLLGCR